LARADRVDPRRPRRALRLAHTHHQQQHGQRRRDHRDGEHRPVVIGPQQHQAHRHQRADEGPDRVERLAQAECGAPLLGRRDIGHQSIAGRAANALADPVQHARRKDQPRASGQRKQRLGQRAQPVADHREHLAAADIVADDAGEHLGDQGRGLGQTLDQPDHGHAHAERAHHEQRQQAVHHLGRYVHQQADKAQRPDAGRQAAQDNGLSGRAIWRRMGGRHAHERVRKPGGRSC
jgi:hypothetical protein